MLFQFFLKFLTYHGGLGYEIQGSKIQLSLAHLIWNPDRNVFIIPYLDHPVTWYGFLFALGFLVGYFLVRQIFYERLNEDKTRGEKENSVLATQLTDRLVGLCVVGTLIGARLGHVFFYGWEYYRAHPWEIIKLWEGGLASHGGTLGSLLGILIFVLWSRRKDPTMTFLSVLDSVVPSGAFVAGSIRIGNFFNQEITGITTQLPWGIIFVHPLDGRGGVPVHPVQLYEAGCYFLIAICLWWLIRKRFYIIGTGLLSGLCFLAVFGVRFLIEFLKMPQHESFDLEASLKMGHWLSFPFLLLGLLLSVYGTRQCRSLKI